MERAQINGRTDGKFQPGNKWAWVPGEPSPNPSGRAVNKAKRVEELERIARDLCPEGLATAANIMRDPKANKSDRLRAIEIILARGMGQPRQYVEIARANQHLSDDDLDRQINGRITDLVTGILAPGPGIIESSAGSETTIDQE